MSTVAEMNRWLHINQSNWLLKFTWVKTRSQRQVWHAWNTPLVNVTYDKKENFIVTYGLVLHLPIYSCLNEKIDSPTTYAHYFVRPISVKMLQYEVV